MRAVRFHTYGDASVLRVEDMAQPAPKRDEVLIRVHAASINPADIGGRQGTLRLVHARHLPHIPGNDVAGEVVACGPTVTAFVPGEKVFAMLGLNAGGQAEYVCAAQSKVARAPERITLTEAAAVPLVGLTALQALRRKARLQPGQRVVINGASGGVGSFAVQIARALGCHVTGVAGSAKVDLVKELGADEVIDYTQEAFTARAERWDVVFDAAGTLNWADVQRVLTPRGVMVVARGTPDNLVPGLLSRFGSGPRYTWMITRTSGQDLDLLARLIDQGRLRPYVDRTFSMDQIQDAHHYFETGKTRGKIVVELAT